MATILHLDDDHTLGKVVARTLQQIGHDTIVVHDVPGALGALDGNTVDLIISDYKMPGLTGLEFLEVVREQGYDTPLILLTGYATVANAVASIKGGAADYLAKPFEISELEWAVTQALEMARLRRENEQQRRELAEYRSERRILGDSPIIGRLLRTIAAAAPTRATILLRGESGTGKELFASAIHEMSDRHDRPFIKLNCAALPDGLVESMLFGHEKGAFTGALKRVAGAFERAHGGTLLLDEISELRLDLQAKLLRVLQEQEFERLGASSTIEVDVRVIATTNRDLAREAAAGSFRQDLFYRLSGLPLEIPPLRERAEDIPLLATHFARRTAHELEKEFLGISSEALEMLRRYEWPGNVRELQHAVERAVILSSSPVLQSNAFPLHSIRGGAGGAPREARAVNEESGQAGAAGPDCASFNLAEAEDRLIRGALAAAGDNRTRAAALLGISVRTLWNKLNKMEYAGAREHAEKL
ncbi:MAG TPA: sigma-54 dependent transcriptional regulator [Gemmatimonadaceae bacterium]|nr:sigma-54 dependent transcriptional regulator [Gemmatimonadaceae bacterium]